MSNKMTARQAEVLAFLHTFFDANDCLPSLSVIADHFGWASRKTALECLRRLERHGRLEHNECHGFRFPRAPAPRPPVPEVKPSPFARPHYPLGWRGVPMFCPAQ